MYEVILHEQLRKTILLGNVPEQGVDGRLQGEPLEPVHSLNLNKDPYPELLAVDDFFESDPAFRSDDFPKITLIYTWDDSVRVFKHRSERFPSRFNIPDLSQPLPDSIELVDLIQRVMTLAAVKRCHEARALMILGFTADRLDMWKAEAPARTKHIKLDRLQSKLELCIRRYL